MVSDRGNLELGREARAEAHTVGHSRAGAPRRGSCYQLHLTVTCDVIDYPPVQMEPQIVRISHFQKGCKSEFLKER